LLIGSVRIVAAIVTGELPGTAAGAAKIEASCAWGKLMTGKVELEEVAGTTIPFEEAAVFPDPPARPA
jgi:hypothetical protein